MKVSFTSCVTDGGLQEMGTGSETSRETLDVGRQLVLDLPLLPLSSPEVVPVTEARRDSGCPPLVVCCRKLSTDRGPLRDSTFSSNQTS